MSPAGGRLRITVREVELVVSGPDITRVIERFACSRQGKQKRSLPGKVARATMQMAWSNADPSDLKGDPQTEVLVP